MRLALRVLDAGEPAVICSHGKVLPELISGICDLRYPSPRGNVSLRKGAFAVLHHVAGKVVGLERYTV